MGDPERVFSSRGREGGHNTEVTFMLLTQLLRVWFSAFPKIYFFWKYIISMFLTYFGGTAVLVSGRSLIVDRTHLVLLDSTTKKRVLVSQRKSQKCCFSCGLWGLYVLTDWSFDNRNKISCSALWGGRESAFHFQHLQRSSQYKNKHFLSWHNFKFFK